MVKAAAIEKPWGAIDTWRCVVVTSFSPDGYQQYAHRFVDSWRKHAKFLPLIIVTEDRTVFPGDWIHCLSLADSEPFNRFVDQFQTNPLVQGRRETKDMKPWKTSARNDGYNFRFDAFKFARKIFAIQQAAELLHQPCRLFWIDADVVFEHDFNAEHLFPFLPEYHSISYLARWDYYHSECGFVGYNLAHECVRDFISRFARLYESGKFMELEEWHDSWMFDWLRNTMGIGGYPIPHRKHRDAFGTSELRHFCRHLKGALKHETS